MKLGVNVDHVATLRQARGTQYPQPVIGAMLCEYAGCDSIVFHLREDRRHINEHDAVLIKEAVKVPVNLEMSVSKEIVQWAFKLKPYQATLVPERRQELTTEGGVDLLGQGNYKKIERVTKQLQEKEIKVSLFVDPDKRQIERAKRIGVEHVEIHTGGYAESTAQGKRQRKLQSIKDAAQFAHVLGFFVAAGHGLDYENVKDIVKIKEIEELNIGHAVVCRAVFVGIIGAVEEMLCLMGRRVHQQNEQ